ncbi:MAG TPA: hypothetical protein VF591_12220 [Pyrinomonadaceae bacterium]|jgi:hypothetical protein
MVIWIVEDSDDDAGKAYEVAAGLAREKHREEYARAVKVYRVSSIEWPPVLLLFEERGARAKVDLAKAKPAIVVLDLFDSGVFKGRDFFQALRKWERNPPPPAPKQPTRDRSFVILWTARAYPEDVGQFLHHEREWDKRVSFTDSKSRLSLRRHLEGFWRQWEEARHP